MIPVVVGFSWRGLSVRGWILAADAVYATGTFNTLSADINVYSHY